jgi:prepilin-type N-terminal cleavage/methylation domain-containing protein
VRWQSGATKPISALRRALLRCTGKMPLPPTSRGFTLVELILVMALLVVGVSFIAPQLGGFFRGRTLQFEARQMISMAHAAQTRAVSGGVPVILWLDKDKNQYGIQEEPGYHDNDKDGGKDPKAEALEVNENLKIEIGEDDAAISQPTIDSTDPHMNLPHITFMPDGTIAEGSPRTINIVDNNNGPKISVTQNRARNQYEIATTTEQQ